VVGFERQFAVNILCPHLFFLSKMPLMRTVLPLLLLSAFFLHCRHQPMATLDPPAAPGGPTQPVFTENVDILALGDSYTKGESVPWAQNFPNQLADSLRAEGRKVGTPRNIAQTGWRTDQLQVAIKSAAHEDIADSTFSIVTLCIGVNNQYQGANFETYKTQFEQLLQTAIQRAGQRPKRVVVLSIPDWAYTPYGQNFSSNPGQISQKIDQYNAANRALAEQYGVHYVNVTDISRQGIAQPNLVAPDGLHPSSAQYKAWVKLLLPVVRGELK